MVEMLTILHHIFEIYENDINANEADGVLKYCNGQSY